MVTAEPQSFYPVGEASTTRWWLLIGVEEPEPVEGCGEDACPTNEMAATDLFCAPHQRFLPFVNKWSNRVRVIGVLVTSILLSGGYVASAETNSMIPVWLAHLLLGLAVATLPLRHFSVSKWVAAISWILVGGMALLLGHADTPTDAKVGTVLLLALTAAFAGHAGHRSAIDLLDHDVLNNDNSEVISAASVCLAVAVFAGLAATLALVLPYPWLSGGHTAAVAAAWIAGLALAGAVVLAATIAFLTGWKSFARLTPISAEVPSVRWEPRRAATPNWCPATRPNQKVYGLHLIPEIILRLVIRLQIALVVTAEFLVNLLFWSIYKLKCGIRRVLNMLKALIVRVGRTLKHIAELIAASLRSLAMITRIVFLVVIRKCGETIILLGVPLLLLATAAVLAVAGAEDTRRYLIHGALAALGGLCACDGLALILATAAWISLVGLNRLRRSLKSATDSTTIAGSYALLLIAIGGWLVGLPGTFGSGVVHVGWVTLGSTALLAVSFLLPRQRSGTSPTSARGGTRSRGEHAK